MALLPAIAVLDIGKSNLKLEVFNQSRESLSQHSVPNSIRPGPPYAHADLERIWDFTVSALTEAARNFVLSDIVVTTHGATAAVLDGEGLALPVLDYEATDPEEYSAEYDLLARDFSNTQSPNLPAGLNLARQLFWLSRRFPEHFARATSILTYPQYWAWRLSGIAASEVTSLGCHSDLWEPARGDHSCFIRHMGWKRLFPPMRAAWDVLGTLLPDLAQTTGIPASCRIRCGIHDSNASYLPHRLSMGERPFTLVSTGTWVIVMAAGASPSTLVENDDMLANVDAFGNAVPCARFMGGREFEVLCRGKPVSLETADIAALVVTGTQALPAFSTIGGPFRDQEGSITGHQPETPQARTALACLYVALMIANLVGRLGGKGDVLIDGPFARSPIIPGLLAALLPQQTITVAAKSATSAGAALLALWPDIPPIPALQTVPALTIPGLAAYAQCWQNYCSPAKTP